MSAESVAEVAYKSVNGALTVVNGTIAVGWFAFAAGEAPCSTWEIQNNQCPSLPGEDIAPYTVGVELLTLTVPIALYVVAKGSQRLIRNTVDLLSHSKHSIR